MTEDTTFNESITVHGNISGIFDLKVIGNIDALDIDALNIDARNINAENIYAENIDAWNINAENIDAKDVYAYAFIVAYSSFKCKSWKIRRENGFAKCLDGEIEIKETICSKCGKKL